MEYWLTYSKIYLEWPFERIDGGPLHFVDWGIKFTTTAVVIGGFQIENNFLLFDLGVSRLGFSFGCDHALYEMRD
ncbi:hypothetical protein G4B88_013992 [Cannabis sativa]|uniref:Xylanase inhibitor C-terminal domain-containing protein n=1 Tax=Cannabis sativa TaxID=3483 RepID=A0A7J6I292_CANSA|nr:hypothetical protein G4B88_013992 [Cannabis sativa]